MKKANWQSILALWLALYGLQGCRMCKPIETETVKVGFDGCLPITETIEMVFR